MQKRVLWLTAAVVVSVSGHAGNVSATPASGFVGTTLAQGRFEEFDARNSALPDLHWQAKVKTQGQSDLYVQSNVWAAGGTTGWHTHPGHSLITVTAGTVTVYDGDDSSCTPRVYTAGMGFVDEGGEHVHVIRNEGPVEARTITVQLIPAGATRRIDAPAPGNCPF